MFSLSNFSLFHAPPDFYKANVLIGQNFHVVEHVRAHAPMKIYWRPFEKHAHLLRITSLNPNCKPQP